MKTKKGDFVSIDYVGIIKGDNAVFDLTDPGLIGAEGRRFDPKIVKIGESDVIPGLDESLVGREENEVYDAEIISEKAFGKKDPKLIKLIALNEFKKHEIDPKPGMQINLDGFVAVVRTVGGGRVTLDFNHPLAGKDILYKIRINRIITDLKERIEGFIRLAVPTAEVNVEKDVVTIISREKEAKELEDVLSRNLKQRFKEIAVVKVETKG